MFATEAVKTWEAGHVICMKSSFQPILMRLLCIFLSMEHSRVNSLSYAITTLVDL